MGIENKTIGWIFLRCPQRKDKRERLDERARLGRVDERARLGEKKTYPWK
jgi:hypothetical protein